jgi:hypothetical protein
VRLEQQQERMMTPERVSEVIATYRRVFQRMKVKKIDYPHDKLLSTTEHGLAHCHGMLDDMERFVKEGDMDKVHRWLGFIQGVLWAQGLYPLDTLREHNRG